MRSLRRPRIGDRASLREPHMAHYRAYAVRFDGNFDGYESLSCTDDDEAIGKARRRSKAELTRYLLTLVINAPSPPSLGSYR